MVFLLQIPPQNSVPISLPSLNPTFHLLRSPSITRSSIWSLSFRLLHKLLCLFLLSPCPTLSTCPSSLTMSNSSPSTRPVCCCLYTFYTKDSRPQSRLSSNVQWQLVSCMELLPVHSLCPKFYVFLT